VPIATLLVVVWAWRALSERADAAPFIAAVLLFLLAYLGVVISLWPMIVPYHFTLSQAAASPSTQAFLLVGSLFLLPAILMYSGWSYWVFRGKRTRTSVTTELLRPDAALPWESSSWKPGSMRSVQAYIASPSSSPMPFRRQALRYARRQRPGDHRQGNYRTVNRVGEFITLHQSWSDHGRDGHGAGRGGAPDRAPEPPDLSWDEEAGGTAAGGAANGNGCWLNADERAGVTGRKSGGGCVGRLGLTTDTSAARVKPGKAPPTTAITVRSLCISSSPSRRRKPATGAVRLSEPSVKCNRPRHPASRTTAPAQERPGTLASHCGARSKLSAICRK